MRDFFIFNRLNLLKQGFKMDCQNGLAPVVKF